MDSGINSVEVSKDSSIEPTHPEFLNGNTFLSEYLFIKDPDNKVSQKYVMLYQVLAPKLVQRTALVNSKVQDDALAVLKALVDAPSLDGFKEKPVMPLLDSSNPLKQDIIYLLSRFVPSLVPSIANRNHINVNQPNTNNIQQNNKSMRAPKIDHQKLVRISNNDMPISPVSIGSPEAPEEFDVQEYELQDSERSNPSDQENIQDDKQRPRVYVDLSQPDDDEEFFDQISENNIPMPHGGVRPPSAL